MSFGLGKVILNKIPYPVLRMLQDDPTMLSDM